MSLCRGSLLTYSVRRNVFPALCVSSRKMSHYIDPHHYKFPTMNQVMYPPEGSWKEHFDHWQKKYNIILIGGIAWLMTAIYFLNNSGLQLHVPTPKNPISRERMDAIRKEMRGE